MAAIHEHEVAFRFGLVVVVDRVPARCELCLLDLKQLAEHHLLKLHVIDDLLVHDRQSANYRVVFLELKGAQRDLVKFKDPFQLDYRHFSVALHIAPLVVCHVNVVLVA